MEVRQLLTYLGYKYDDAGIKKADADVSHYKTGLLGLAGALTVSVAGFAATVASAVNFGYELSLTSQRVGIGVVELQKWEYAAGTVGVSADRLTVMIGFLARNLLAAQAGGKAANEAFKQLFGQGFNAKNFKDTDQLLFAIADKVSKMPDGIKKLGILRTILGRGGAIGIPLFDLGPEQIKALGQEAQNLNAILGEDTVKATRAVHNSLFRLNYIFHALIRGVGIQFVPVLQKATDAMLKWLAANSKLIGSGIHGFFNSLAIAAQILWSALRTVTAAIDILLKPFGGLEKHIKFLTGTGGLILVALLLKGLIPWVVSLAGSFLGLSSAATGSILAIIGVATGLVLVVQDLFNFMEGKHSLLGEIFGDRDQKNARHFRYELEKIYEYLKKISDLTANGIVNFFLRGQGVEQRTRATEVVPRSERFYENPPSILAYNAPRPSFAFSRPSQTGPSNVTFGDLHIEVNGADAGIDHTKLAEEIKDVFSDMLDEKQYELSRTSFSGQSE